MAGSKEDFIKDLPSGPLDYYRKQAKFDWKTLKLFFEDAELLKIKMHVWETLEKDPVFQRPQAHLETEEMKRRTAVQLKKYLQYSFLHPDTAKLPYKRKTRMMMTVNEALAVTFPDVSVKHAVGISLFKNTLTTLGTERHQHILDASWNNKVLSCLALTEVAHGSNIKRMQTTATYDPKTREFVINTPAFEAAKCWVGNLGKTCTLALLFAQLYTKGQCHGVHPFVVPIRDPKTLEPYSGIVVGDMGEKIGLHGIDNGFVMFKNYRIPRENLLNRTSDVTPEGDYESSFTDPARILGAALENLSTGRVGIMQESSNNLICAVTISIRYGAVRRQFAPNGDGENGNGNGNGNGHKEELPIIEYQLHRWRLFPYMAAAAVLKIFVNSFTDMYLSVVEQSTTSREIENLSEMVSEIHALVSCAKPIVTWTCRDAVQESREACGGHGFLKASRLGELRCIIEPCVTYEGDNNVLVQQTSNWLLRQWCSISQGNELSSPLGSCTFLKDHRNISQFTFKLQNPPEALREEFISECYQWLLWYLLKETDAQQSREIAKGADKFTAKCNSQVYRAAVIPRAFLEYTALRHFWAQVYQTDSSLRPVLSNLGLLYGLSCLDKHLVYFYQGGYAKEARFSSIVKDAILHLCEVLKPDALGVIDGMAPPDYVVNSILGSSDGNLYENIRRTIVRDPDTPSRPSWWKEVIIEGAPDFAKAKSKL